MFQPSILSPLLLFLVVFSTHANANTKMAQALAQAKIPKACQQKLIRIADDIIGKKRHRVLEKTLSNSTTFQAFVLLSYNDQDTHLSFTATETPKGCQVNMNESFELPANCLEARQALFKRWALIGQLSNTTYVLRYDHPRKKVRRLADENARAIAFLTQTRNGKACLISKQQQDMPEPPQKQED